MKTAIFKNRKNGTIFRKIGDIILDENSKIISKSSNNYPNLLNSGKYDLIEVVDTTENEQEIFDNYYQIGWTIEKKLFYRWNNLERDSDFYLDLYNYFLNKYETLVEDVASGKVLYGKESMYLYYLIIIEGMAKSANRFDFRTYLNIELKYSECENDPSDADLWLKVYS